MRKRYVYLLGTHESYGSENLIATMYREELSSLLMSHFKPYEQWNEAQKHAYEMDKIEAQIELRNILEKDNEELCTTSPKNCQKGWGGIQLHVVEISGGDT